MIVFFNIQAYILIAAIITGICFISFIVEDWECLDFQLLISDITNATIIGVSWITSVLILCVGNIIITLSSIYANIKVKNQDDSSDK